MAAHQAAALASLRQQCETCRRCGLGEQRQQVVVGRGNPAAPLMLIGEAPGAEEDLTGLPFVGRSGQLLDQLLIQAGFDLQRDLYICNAIKCRPPGNRRPAAAELQACRPWLEAQIAAVDPQLVVLVGATALEAVLGLKGGITRLRGNGSLLHDAVIEAVSADGRRLLVQTGVIAGRPTWWTMPIGGGRMTPSASCSSSLPISGDCP